jgi:hypothetical protein
VESIKMEGAIVNHISGIPINALHNATTSCSISTILYSSIVTSVQAVREAGSTSNELSAIEF